MATDITEGTFIEFAIVADTVNAASSPAEKVTRLSQYFAQLRDDHLLHAVRYFAGQAFPWREQPAAQVGEVTLISALSILSGAEPADLTVQKAVLGDLGEVAAGVLRQTEATLSLEDVAIALEQLSRNKGRRKLTWVVRLLEHATALEAKYLIRLLSGDLYLGLSDDGIEAAIAEMSNQPLPQIQWVDMLLGDLGKTAILARHGQLEQARMQLFQPLKFMLASAVQDPTQVLEQLPQGFAVEPKYDGIRAQAHIAPADRTSASLRGTIFAGIRVALFSRTLQEITHSFPDLILPLAALEPHALVAGNQAGLVLDGEIVPYQDEQILPFTALQPRLDQQAQAPSADLLQAVPVAFIVYDVLYKDGQILLDQPYWQRRQVLESLVMETPKVRLAVSQQFFELEVLERQYLQARSQGQEGLMVKALHSLYRPGRRSRDWLKIRRAIATLDVVITAAEVDDALNAAVSTADIRAARISVAEFNSAHFSPANGAHATEFAGVEQNGTNGTNGVNGSEPDADTIQFTAPELDVELDIDLDLDAEPDTVEDFSDISTAELDIAECETLEDLTDTTWFSNYTVAVRTSATNPTLLSIGKVSAGLTLIEQVMLSDWVLEHSIEEFANGRVRLVEPQIVLEVMFERLQPSPRQKSGYVLIEARVVRIRSDKTVDQIDTLDTVAQLAELQLEDWWDSRL